MYIIEVHFCTEFIISGACEEIQAAVTSQNVAGLFYNSSYGSVAQNIIISCTAGDFQQFSNRIFKIAGIYKMQFNSFFFVFSMQVVSCCPMVSRRESWVSKHCASSFSCTPQADAPLSTRLTCAIDSVFLSE